MTGKAKDEEFRHPEAVAQLQGLTDEEAAKRLALVREHDGVATRQRREGGQVRCLEVAAEASVSSSSEMEAVHAAAEAEFGCARFRTYEANADRMRYDLCRDLGPPVGSGVLKAPASKSPAAASSGPDAAGRRPEPTPCSPSNAASKTGARPTSSIGELAKLQPLDPKI